MSLGWATPISHFPYVEYCFLGKSQQISDVKNGLQSSLSTQSRILDSLDSLGEKMESMLQEQNGIEVIYDEILIEILNRTGPDGNTNDIRHVK